MLKQMLMSHNVTWSACYLTKRMLSTKWDLLSAVCVERLPVITKPKNEMETKFQNFLKQIDFENSMKCDHEVRKEYEQSQLELQKKGMIDVDLEVITNQTAQDLEDLWNEEYKHLKLAPRTTEFDKKNVVTSIERKLDQTLVLLTEHKIGDQSFWIPPQGIRQEGETMRQAAERVLQDICGTELSVQFYGNAPIGFYKYEYPISFKKENDRRGAKLFYFLARYVNGCVSNKVKYQWLDQNELESIIPPKMYKSVSKFLL